MSVIYENILQESQKKGYSISKLEREAGLSKGTIDKWKRCSPTVSNLQAVAKVLKVKIEKLMQ